MSYTDSLPFGFIGLIDTENANVEKRLKWLKSLWESLEKLNETSWTVATARNFIKNLIWPCNTLAMEFFGGVAAS